jgi:4-hydroxy-tetrahydrodipicolinate synthase
MAKSRFTGIYPMLYTYFDADGGLDRAAMQAQIDACLAGGAHGIAILGIVGEFNKQSVAERRAVLDLAAETLAGRRPLAVTICEPSIAGQIEFVRAAEAARADWVILQPPPIKGVPEAELVRFFGAVAARASAPVAIQNNPVNLDVWLSDQGLKTLARNHPNICLLKGEGPVHIVRRTIEATEGAFDVFSGLGGKELPASLAAGCVGCVPAPDCVDVEVEVFRLASAGRLDEADALHRTILPLLQFVLHSPEHMLCYGKRLFARRAGIATVHPRAPAIMPEAFSTAVVERLAKVLPELKHAAAARA